MDNVGTAIVVVLALLAVGIVIDRLFALKRWLESPPPIQQVEKPPEADE